MPSTLSIWVPGLLGPMPGMSPWPEAAETPGLTRWLARADSRPCAGTDGAATLCALFGLEAAPERDLPLAALSRLGEGSAPDWRHWLHADPVCLRPDQSRLLLFDSRDFDLSMNEAEALAGLLRQHFADAGWTLETPDPCHWYLSPERPPRLRTQGLEQVFGRNMDPFLPAGEDALAWHALMNEIQMLFFQADLNRAREAAGKMPIGGLWFHGGGRLPETLPAAPFQWLAAVPDQPLARGLARHAGVTPLALPDHGAALPLAQGDGLACYPFLQRPQWRADPYDWHEALMAFDHWLEPLIDALRQRRLARLLIYPGNGRCFRLDRKALRRFWRRGGDYDAWLEGGG